MLLIRISILFLLLMLFFNGVISADNTNRAQRREATEKSLSELQSKIKQLQSRQAKNRSSLSSEQQALKQTDLLIGQSTKSLNKIRRQLKGSQARLLALSKQRIALNHDKAKQLKALRDQIRAAYVGGKQEYLKLMLNQQDPSKLGRTLVYYDYLNKARLENIASLNVTLVKLVKVETEIIAQQQQLKRLEAKHQQENTRLVVLKKDRQQSISNLNRSLISASRRLKEWQVNERDLQSLLEALKHTVATLLPEESLDGLASLTGKLSWPVRGRIKERFGKQRGDVQIRWSGVLITAEEGQKVSAIHHGRVVYSDYLRGFGLITIIDHGAGYMSLYGHNEALYKQAGDWVEAGEQIATVGQSGGYPRTGLYFEIRLRSKALNPALFIHSG